MRICFTSDLHGARRHYDELEELLRAETPDLLILGGDLMPDGDVDNPVESQLAFVRRDFMQRVDVWRSFAPRMTVTCLVGNHEWSCVEQALRSEQDAGRLVLLDHHHVWRHEGIGFLGFAITPPTPHNVKDFERRDMPDDDVPEFSGVIWDAARRQTRDAELVEHFRRQPTVAEELEQIETPAEPWILVAHAPPHGTKLDRLPGLSYPIGSRAVRAFIEQRQPYCSLHGHVHESPAVTGSYIDRLGRTLCVNPGQSRERLHAVLFDAEHPAQTIRHTVLK